MKRIQEFDGIRTLAVAIVIADHYAPFRSFANGAAARLGGIGVDIFFVLSGFLITTILLELKGSRGPYRVFYARRFLRILPPFMLCLTTVYSLAFLFGESIEKSKAVEQLLFLRSFKESPSVLAHVRDVFVGATPIPGLFHKMDVGTVTVDYPLLPISGSLGPTWSLSVEEWFYVLWAPVVLMFRRRAIVAVALATCGLGLILRWCGGNRSDFFSSVDILVVGALLAVWIENRETFSPFLRGGVRIAATTLSLAAFALYVILTVIHRDLLSRTLIEIFVVGALAWIIGNAGGKQPLCRALRFRPLVYLGSISYMLYLIHLPVYFLVRSGLTACFPQVPIEARYWLVAVCSLAVTIGFSALSWTYYEKPILSVKDRVTVRIKDAVERREELQSITPGELAKTSGA